jgi:ATP-dependent DNA helicase RecG
MESRFHPGAQLTVTGKVKLYQGNPEIVHPEITWGLSSDTSGKVGEEIHVGRIIPVYTELEGVPSRTFRKVLWESIQKFGESLSEDLPPYLLSKYQLPNISKAIRHLHFPSEENADLGKLATV